MKHALITGATSGIGYELAKIFYEKGYGLIITSSNTSRLKETRDKLFDGKPIYIFTEDLSKQDSAIKLYNSIKNSGLNVDVLINNAGIGYVGNDNSISLEDTNKMLNINIISLVNLTKLYLNDMIKNDYGMILNISSTGAFQPGPFTSAYFASKSFVLNYTLGIKEEINSENIKISVLCPGSTETSFFEKAGQDMPKSAMKPRRVAIYAYHGLMKNKDIIIPGIKNKAMQIFPTWIKSKAIKEVKKK